MFVLHKMTQSETSPKYSLWISLRDPTRAFEKLAGPPCAGSEALRSCPWRRFRGSAGSRISVICVPFCAFLMKKRDRNHFRPPQDDPKRDLSSAERPMASFPWLHVLHRLHDLQDLCSILRIFDGKKESKFFRPPQDDPKRQFTQVQPLDKSWRSY